MYCVLLFCSHRCGLTNEDLNRRWSHPNQHLHPVIYHTKVSFCILITSYLFLISHLQGTCSAHLVVLDVITLIYNVFTVNKQLQVYRG
jgi:hypothetical protein